MSSHDEPEWAHFWWKSTIRGSKEPTEITTAETMEEAAVHVNDLDVFVTMMAVLSFGFWCGEMGYVEKERVSILD